MGMSLARLERLEQLTRVRELLRVKMIETKCTEERATFEDGFHDGLHYAIGEIDRALRAEFGYLLNDLRKQLTGTEEELRLTGKSREIAVNWILAVRRAARESSVSASALVEGATKVLDEQLAALHPDTEAAAEEGGAAE